MPGAIGIVADDLTGGNDAAAEFAAGGWSRVTNRLPGRSFGRFDRSTESVVAVSTMARHLGFDMAYRRTAEAMRALFAAGADRIFVKVDSTGRGSLAAQVAAVADVWRSARESGVVVLCPAHPRLGRTVEAGRVLVHGTGVARTAYAAELDVRSSRLSEIVPGVRAISAGRAGLRAHLDRIGSTRPGAVVAVDAASPAELDAIAAAVAELGARAVPIGSGGLAAALAARWYAGAARQVRRTSGTSGPANRVANRVIVLVSSRNPAARVQLTRLMERWPAEDRVWRDPSPAHLLDPIAWQQLACGVRRAAAAGTALTVLSVGDQGAPEVDGRAVAAALGRLAAAAITADGHEALVGIGGDGSAAMLEAVGAAGVRVAGTLGVGQAYGWVDGGPYDRLPVITRAGGFGDPDALAPIVRFAVAGFGPEDGAQGGRQT